MKLRLAMPPAVIDIGRIQELRGISRSGDTIRIGALTTHAELAASADLQKSAAALAEAAALVGEPAVRSRGTIGGNIAHADPASDLPTVLVALDARITAIGPNGTRAIAAEDFFTGIMSTALAEDEVVSEIVLTASTPGQGSAYVKFSHPASRYAVVGAAALVSMEKDQCRAARVAVGGLLPHATRAKAVEAALVGKAGTATTIEAAAAQLHADLGVLARRARYINVAIALSTTSALLTALVVTLLFASEFVPLGVGGAIALMFVGSMACLSSAFLMFLLEVRIAINALRIGSHRNY